MNYDTRVTRQYYEHLTRIIDLNNQSPGYSKLINQLFHTEYIYNPRNNDVNRSIDGKELRKKYSGYLPEDYVIGFPCSVLEMMVALAIRIETDIMGEPGDDHPERWFWAMVKNSVLGRYTDKNYSLTDVEYAIYDILTHRFDSHGTGSFFPIKGAWDAREMELWQQANTWLIENYGY